MALVAGAVFGIWRGYNPSAFSSGAFVEQHQNAVRGLNTLMPVLGLLANLFTLAWAYTQRGGDRTVLISLLVAVVFMIISGLVTRFGNQPINAIIMTWDSHSVPANWQELRDKWWQFHLVRTGTSCLALAILVFTIVKEANSQS